jgi:hypothetical protein
VHGCPLKYSLRRTSAPGSSSISLAWDSVDKFSAKSGCAPIEHYELEVKSRLNNGNNSGFINAVSWEPWRDLLGPNEKSESLSYIFNSAGQCTDFKFRGRAVNKYCAGDYSDPIGPISSGCPTPVIETAPALTTVQATLSTGCNIMFSWL